MISFSSKAAGPPVPSKSSRLLNIIIRLPFEPWLWFAYHFILRLGFLEGRRGLIASQIRAAYISQVRGKVYELKLASARMGRRSGAVASST